VRPTTATRREICVPLFNIEIEFCVCNHEDLDNADDLRDDAAGGFDRDSYKLWINLKHDCDVDFLQTLAHECGHAAFWIARDISNGEWPESMIGEELICYLLDDIFGKCVKGCWNG